MALAVYPSGGPRSSFLRTRRDLALLTDSVLGVCLLCRLCLSPGLSYPKEGKSDLRLPTQQPVLVVGREYGPLGMERKTDASVTSVTCGIVILSVTDMLSGADS